MAEWNYQKRWGKRYHFDNVYVPLLPLSSVRLYQAGEIIADSGYEIKEHRQCCVEISYVMSGEGIFCVDGQNFHVQEGDLHVISPGKMHSIQVSGSAVLRMAYIGFVFYEGPKTEERAALEDFFVNAPLSVKNDSIHIKPLFEKLLTEIYISQPYSKEIMDACINQILVHSYRLFVSGEIDTSPKVVEEARMDHIVGHAVFQTLRYIDSNIEQVKSVSQIAEELNYNPAYLSRIFHMKMGLTISDYILDGKIAVAKSLLKKGLSVSEVAYRVGYSSSQSFCKMFSKHVKCSPSAYCKEVSQKEQEIEM